MGPTHAPAGEFTKAIEDLDRQTDLEAKKYFEEKQPISAPRALSRMVGAFWKVYFKERSRREGVKGLFRAVNAGMFHFLTYAKHWELERSKRTGA